MLPRQIHVLHIGKTGGSALGEALWPHALACGIVLHGHDCTLRDIPSGEGVAFIVRDPVRRFVSGFNSRLRKGAPRTFVDWTEAEALAFSQFATPAALSDGLVSDDDTVRHAAAAAMNGIYHPARWLAFWLGSASYVRERRGDIVWVGHTDRLDEDFALLVRRLGLPASLRMPKDAVARHATPDGFATTLTIGGEAAITDWYRGDAEILAACLELREDMAGRHRQPCLAGR